MPFRCGARVKRAKVAAFAGLGVGLARIQAVTASRQFADHGGLMQLA